MSKPKLGPWHPENVKPVHVGVYETRIDGQRKDRWFNKWDGEDWLISGLSVGHADQQRTTSVYRSLEWRGLAEQPK